MISSEELGLFVYRLSRFFNIQIYPLHDPIGYNFSSMWISRAQPYSKTRKATGKPQAPTLIVIVFAHNWYEPVHKWGSGGGEHHRVSAL